MNELNNYIFKEKFTLELSCYSPNKTTTYRISVPWQS